LSDGAWGTLMGASVTLTLLEKSATILAAIFSEITDNSGYIGYSTTFAALTQASLLVVPVQDLGNGIDNDGNIWMPAVVPLDLAAFIHKLEESDASQETYPINMRANRRATDQAGQAIAADAQIFFTGDADDVISGGTSTTSWETGLPAAYDTA